MGNREEGAGPRGQFNGMLCMESTKAILQGYLYKGLIKDIRMIQKRHHRRYVSPQINHELSAMGIHVGRKRIAKPYGK